MTFVYVEPLRDQQVSGYEITPQAGSVEQWKKPQATFCVSVKHWLQADKHIWVPSFWNLRILRI
jgi:uncharacterized protein with von Willebrand factor type A (vWA) domain